jgi:hypothetical protein
MGDAIAETEEVTGIKMGDPSSSDLFVSEVI